MKQNLINVFYFLINCSIKCHPPTLLHWHRSSLLIYTALPIYIENRHLYKSPKKKESLDGTYSQNVDVYHFAMKLYIDYITLFIFRLIQPLLRVQKLMNHRMLLYCRALLHIFMKMFPEISSSSVSFPLFINGQLKLYILKVELKITMIYCLKHSVKTIIIIYTP